MASHARLLFTLVPSPAASAACLDACTGLLPYLASCLVLYPHEKGGPGSPFCKDDGAVSLLSPAPSPRTSGFLPCPLPTTAFRTKQSSLGPSSPWAPPQAPCLCHTPAAPSASLPLALGLGTPVPTGCWIFQLLHTLALSDLTDLEILPPWGGLP